MLLRTVLRLPVSSNADIRTTNSAARCHPFDSPCADCRCRVARYALSDYHPSVVNGNSCRQLCENLEGMTAAARSGISPVNANGNQPVGPAHRGVFGRRAGRVAGYDYSDALRASKVVWNEKTLDAWLTRPEDTIPRQKMGYQVTGAIDRADLIADLRKVSPP